MFLKSVWVCFCFVNKFICIYFLIPHISDIVWYLSFSGWLTSLSIIICESTHVSANGIISSFFHSWVIFHFIYVPHLYSFICWWTFRLFAVLAIVNSSAMNIGVRVSFQVMFFSRYMPKSVITGSCEVKVLAAQSCLILCDPMDCSLPGSSVQGIFRGKNTGVIPFSKGSSWPRDRTRVSCIAGRFSTIWARREAQKE